MCPLADSYVAIAAREAGSVAELVAARKSTKHTDLDTCYTFQAIAIEPSGHINDCVRKFLLNLDRKISLHSDDNREMTLCFSNSLF